jgi:hypothetical protein
VRALPGRVGGGAAATAEVGRWVAVGGAVAGMERVEEVFAVATMSPRPAGVVVVPRAREVDAAGVHAATAEALALVQGGWRTSGWRGCRWRS